MNYNSFAFAVKINTKNSLKTDVDQSILHISFSLQFDLKRLFLLNKVLAGSIAVNLEGRFVNKSDMCFPCVEKFRHFQA